MVKARVVITFVEVILNKTGEHTIKYILSSKLYPEMHHLRLLFFSADDEASKYKTDLYKSRIVYNNSVMTSTQETNVTLFYDQEDHTLGNILRHQLLKHQEVLFAGYKITHPLKRSVEVRVQTLDTPVVETVRTALEEIVKDLDDFDEAFNDALTV
uniref:RNA polymerase Rpb3/Rpb11 dimerization domain protein n=1 Tax=Marseillevirus LCMAC201 TaxID=2506605 RepID=A0A481YWN5_9VIRU|nr:MAG: RNA polymerase Rpb3/Rpb11 dimerization domain protein [Marseillevirus LCMAC201]